MPNLWPTIQFVAPPVLFGSAIALELEADGTLGRPEDRASLEAEEAPGSGATLVSLGFDAGIAPAGTTTLAVQMNGLAGVNALVTAFLSVATADAAARVYVEEFSPSGAFLNAQEGAPATVYANTENGFGADARLNDFRSVNLSSSFSVTPGNFYRVWIDSLQTVANSGVGPQSYAILSCVYDWGISFFRFF